MWVQLQITKYCITNISAQLLLSKHRHSKKPTGTKSQQVTSQGYLQSKDINRILIIYFFLRFTCRREIQNDTNLSCQNNRGKVGKTAKFIHLFEKKGMKFARIYQNLTRHWPRGTNPNFTPLGSSASIQKSRLSSLSHHFLLF